MKLFTVLLLYPDYVANNYGEDTYLWLGSGVDVQDAVQQAQREAAVANKCSITTAPDFMCLFCTHGHHDNFSPNVK